MIEKCVKCGAQLPQFIQLNIAQPWEWHNLCSILVKNVPIPTCPHCDSNIPVQSITVLPLPNSRRIFVIFGEYKDEAIFQQIKAHFQAECEQSQLFEILPNLEALIPHITEHVLSYKPLLKSLSYTQYDGSLIPFVSEHWSELTPIALAAGLVGVTGLVSGIGGEAINIETRQKERASLEEKLESFKYFFSKIQAYVWLSIIQANFTSEITFESVLNKHVLTGGIYGENLNIFADIVERIENDENAQPLIRYTALALYACLTHKNEEQNRFSLKWAEEYFLFELELAKQDDEQNTLLPWRISSEWAAEIIEEKDAWDIVGYWLVQNLNDLKYIIPLLKSIAGRLGYKNLVTRVMASFIISGSDNFLFELACTRLNETKKDSDDWPNAVLQTLSSSLIQAADIGLIEKIYAYVSDQANGNFDQQADLEAWYGMCLKELRQPQRFINLIGESPREWEHQLNPKKRIDLWNERSNALRLMGKPDDALAITESLLELTNGNTEFTSQNFVLLRNRAILLRETGALDASISQLNKLLNNCPLEDKAGLLESIAATYLALGRLKEAASCLESAIPVGGKIKQRLKAQLGMIYVNMGFNNQALEQVKSLDQNALSDIEAILVVTVYSVILFRGQRLEEPEYEQLSRNFDRLREIAVNTEANGDFQFLPQILTLIAQIVHYFDEENSEDAWQKLLSISSDLEQPSPIALARLATLEYRRSNRDKAIELIMMLPDALVASFGNIKDLSIAFNSTHVIRPTLTDLMNAAINANAPWSDIRLIAELQRDTIGQARLIQQRQFNTSNIIQIKSEISDDVLSCLAPKEFSIGIF